MKVGSAFLDERGLMTPGFGGKSCSFIEGELIISSGGRSVKPAKLAKRPIVAASPALPS